jgi:hypothetical protein
MIRKSLFTVAAALLVVPAMVQAQSSTVTATAINRPARRSHGLR